MKVDKKIYANGVLPRVCRKKKELCKNYFSIIFLVKKISRALVNESNRQKLISIVAINYLKWLPCTARKMVLLFP